jgi:ribonuclease E
VKHALSRIAASTITHDESGEPLTGIATTVSPVSVASPTSPVAPAAETPAETTGGSKRRRRRGSRAGDGQQAPAQQAQAADQASSTLDLPAAEAVLPGTTAGVDTTDAQQEAPAPATQEVSAPQAPVEQSVAPQRAAAEPAAQAAPKERPAGRRRVSSSAAITPADTTVAILDIPVGVAKREPRRVSEEAAESLLDSVLQALPEPKQPGQGRSRSRRVSSGSISAPANPAGTDGTGTDGIEDDGTVIVGR